MYRVVSTKRKPNITSQKWFSNEVEAIQYKGQLEATGEYCYVIVEHINKNKILYCSCSTY